MPQNRHSDEDMLKVSGGSHVASACRGVGISAATCYNWRRRFGGMGRLQLYEVKSLEKESTRLMPIVAKLELDEQILTESLNYIKL